jgi:hypothetical protein
MACSFGSSESGKADGASLALVMVRASFDNHHGGRISFSTRERIMTKVFSRVGAWLLTAALLLEVGCKSANTNSPVARANTGYVDFYASTNAPLSWEIKQISPETKTLFSQVNPVTEPIVRIALPPGRYKLQITFLNRAIDKPAELELDVRDGMIIPVKVELQGAGEVSSRRVEETTVGPSVKAPRAGRDIEYPSTALYRITFAPQQPTTYRPKEAMPYSQ